METEIEKKVTVPAIASGSTCKTFTLFTSQVASLGVTGVVKTPFFIVHCNYLCR